MNGGSFCTIYFGCKILLGSFGGSFVGPSGVVEGFFGGTRRGWRFQLGLTNALGFSRTLRDLLWDFLCRVWIDSELVRMGSNWMATSMKFLGWKRIDKVRDCFVSFVCLVIHLFIFGLFLLMLVTRARR